MHAASLRIFWRRPDSIYWSRRRVTPLQGLLAQTVAELPDLRGNVMHDLHTAVLMREHGISQICTRDADFRRFPFLTMIDPLG